MLSVVTIILRQLASRDREAQQYKLTRRLNFPLSQPEQVFVDLNPNPSYLKPTYMPRLPLSS